MTERKYKRIIKKLENIYTQIRDNQPNYKREEYSNVKIKLLRVIKTLDANKYWWSKK